jgi:DNA-binding NarL/FixJ family response regulator
MQEAALRETRPKSGKNVRILVADDHDVVRRGVRSLLEIRPGWKVCAEAASGREAIAKTRQLKPDVVVLDANLPDCSGAEVLREIRQSLPETEVLILTMDQSPSLMRELLRAGARGYVFKSDVGSDLVTAVEALSHHRQFFTSEVSQTIYQDYFSGRADTGGSEGLTGRQQEVVRLLAEGKTNKEVASALRISVKTAEKHRSNIMTRLKLKSFSELVRYAVREGIISQ